LFEHNLLAPEEREELLTWWQKLFAQAQRLPHGAERRTHLREAGIPKSLFVEWTKQLQRRSKTIRKLEAAAGSHEDVA
jgi:hypothetical protein